MKCLNQQQMALKHYLNFKVICSSSGLRLLPHKIKSLLVHRALQKYCCMYTAAEGIFWLRLLFLNSFVKWEFECLCRLGYMKQGISWFSLLRKKMYNSSTGMVPTWWVLNCIELELPTTVLVSSASPCLLVWVLWSTAGLNLNSPNQQSRRSFAALLLKWVIGKRERCIYIFIP